jgi:hypothetical protein
MTKTFAPDDPAVTAAASREFDGDAKIRSTFKDDKRAYVTSRSSELAASANQLLAGMPEPETPARAAASRGLDQFQAQADEEWEKSGAVQARWIDKGTFMQARSAELRAQSQAAVCPQVTGPDAIIAQAKTDWASNRDDCQKTFINEDIFTRAMLQIGKVR